MTELLAYANASPYLAFFLGWFVISYSCKFALGVLKFVNVLFRGWPPAVEAKEENE